VKRIFAIVGAVALVAVLSFPVSAAPSRAPDLIVDQYYLHQGGPPFVDELTFEPDSCVVQEGYATAGTHRLLRFSTVVENVGAADLMLGKPRADDPNWIFSPCHQHWHFVHFAEYRLLAADGTEVGIGHKQAFCVMDGNPVVTNPSRPRFTCERQGLSVGWEDAYFANLSGQWIVIDNLAPGTYTLSINVNYAAVLTESDYSNNTATVQVAIP
jgi:hypothetical protein